MSLLPPSPSSPQSMSQPQNSWEGNQAVPQSVGGPGQATGFDILGPLQRRKYLVALFCLIGAGLGYLHYLNTPKVYSSATRLLISTQAPPSLVDGDLNFSKVSLPKHASMISSELVLAEAAKNGKFDELKSFNDTSFPVAALKGGMLSVFPESKNNETLIITCQGTEADELPSILNQVTIAYKEIVADDDQNIGQETIDLIQKLASKVSGEKDDAEQTRLRLWKQLGIQSTDANGNVINPYNKRLYDLQAQGIDLNQKLRETQERAKLLASSLQPDQETGVIDPIQVKVAAIEAQDFLGLTRAVFKEEELGGNRIVRNLSVEMNQRQALRGRIWTIDTQISDLLFRRAERSEVLGPGHKTIVAIDDQIKYYEQQKANLANEVETLNEYIEKQTALADATEEQQQANATPSVDLATFRSEEDREWISMYQLALSKEQERLVGNLKAINTEINDVSQKAESVAEGIVQLNLLQKQIDEKSQAVGIIMDRLSQMNILASNYTMTKVKVLDPPKRGRQIAPNMAKSVALGTMLAFLAGLGLAILVDKSEMAFRNPHEIFSRLQIPVVGRIPRINIRKVQATHGHASLIAAHKPNATASESFRDVRTGLFFRSNLEDIKTILFTSPSPGDGKSTTIGNMAVSIAQAGKRVIVVDADFRRPRVHQYFGEELTPGMLDVLSGEKSLREAIQPSQLQENLFLLTTGGRPKNPGELVTSEAFRELIDALRGRFDYVLIDSPPVLPVADPATIASLVDGVYLVTRIRKGVKLTAQKAKETLDRVGANWLGVIVNGIDENPHYSEYGYQYGNYSYYGGYGYGRYYDYSDRKPYRERIPAKSS